MNEYIRTGFTTHPTEHIMGKQLKRTTSLPTKGKKPPTAIVRRKRPLSQAAEAKRLATLVETAIELAVAAHHGQTDKYHQPYILHVLGVAGRCRSVEEKIVAFLHDVVEDTDTTCDDLRKRGFPEHIVEAVDRLTRRRGENYDEFVERIAPNALARAVKLADLEDNMDIRRSNRAMKDKDAERMEKYRKAWQYLAGKHVEK